MSGEDMSKKGTIQLSMNIDPELKDELKILAIKKGTTLTELILGYIQEGISKEEK